jgi:hypothetical protein
MTVQSPKIAFCQEPDRRHPLCSGFLAMTNIPLRYLINTILRTWWKLGAVM